MGGTRIAALKTGFGVPVGHFAATVHSVFRKALILRLESGLATLVPETAGGMPGGITIDAPPVFAFDRIIPPDAKAAARGGVLRIAAGALTIDLRTAAPWRSPLAGLGLDMSAAPVRAGWMAAAALLRADGRAAPLVALAKPMMQALRDSARAFDLAGANAAIRGLVGLGAGGTPAGDDLVVGLLAGLWASAGKNPQRTAFARALAPGVAAEAHRTNEVSRVYLGAAAAGEVSERLSDLAAAMAAGVPIAGLRRAVAGAIAVGHSSGADGTLGFLLGVAAWGFGAGNTWDADLVGDRPGRSSMAARRRRRP